MIKPLVVFFFCFTGQYLNSIKMAHYHEPVSAGIIIYRRSHGIQYLLIQERTNGFWAPPKGKVDPGESEFGAAKRETREECGLSQRDLDIKHGFDKTVYYQLGYNRRKRVVYFLAEVYNPNVHIRLSEEHTDKCWSNLHEAVSLVNYPPVQEALYAANNHIH